MNMDDALNTFVIEGRELLEQMEEALLRIEQVPDDADTINAIFRAAHTIKGSSGLFGFDSIVAFTHVAESVLDRVRSGELRIDSPLVALFLAVRDHLGILIEQVAGGGDPAAEAVQAGAGLVEKLRTYLGGPAPADPAKPVPDAPDAAPTAAADGVDTENWHISLRFGRDVLKSGMDPLAFIRYLTTFGRIDHMVTLVDTVPPLAILAPEECHLGFEIGFRTDADKATIEGAFDFVRADAAIQGSRTFRAEFGGFARPPLNHAGLGPACRQ